MKKRIAFVIPVVTFVTIAVAWAFAPQVYISTALADEACECSYHVYFNTGVWDWSCWGLSSVNIHKKDKLTGADLGGYKWGCWSCSQSKTIRVTHDGYLPCTVRLNPQQSANAHPADVFVYLCPRPTPTPTPTPTPPTCGATWTEITPPYAQVRTEPPFPIVVGQDPDRRGVDVPIRVWGGKVEYHWQVLRKVCDNSECTEWHWVCEEHQNTYPDPVKKVDVTIWLSDASRRWIEKDLAQRYPGAKVKGAYPITLEVYRGGTMYFDGGPRKLQLQDPGAYEFTVRVETMGTPRSDPQVKSFSGTFKVHLLRDTMLW